MLLNEIKNLFLGRAESFTRVNFVVSAADIYRLHFLWRKENQWGHSFRYRRVSAGGFSVEGFNLIKKLEFFFILDKLL